jgi:hypothetical protein
MLMLMPAAGGGEVLLVAHTRLSLGYVLDHYRLLRQDPGLRFTLTRAPDQYPAGVEEMMGGTGLRRVPYCVAVRRPWDLALFGTHGSEVFFTAGRASTSSTASARASSWTARITPTARSGSRFSGGQSIANRTFSRCNSSRLGVIAARRATGVVHVWCDGPGLPGVAGGIAAYVHGRWPSREAPTPNLACGLEILL